MTRAASFLLFVAIVAATFLSASAKMYCEELLPDRCAFSVSSSGHRCVLEKTVLKSGEIQYECQTSVVTADYYPHWVETDACIKSCGAERLSVGMSSDSLTEKDFTKSLCSSACQSSCPNIFDLYSKLAAGEGVSLTDVCKAQRSNSRKMMAEIRILASQSRDHFLDATTPAPAPSHTMNDSDGLQE